MAARGGKVTGTRRQAAADRAWLERHQPNGDRRRGAERRKHTLRALLMSSFRTRRRGPRRERDTGVASTDWHHPQWLAVGLLILALSISDAVLTLRLLEHGALEANPLMAMLISGSDLAFALIKIGLTAAGVFMLTIAVRVRAFGRLRVGILMYALLAGYAVLVAYEVWLLRGTGSDV